MRNFRFKCLKSQFEYMPAQYIHICRYDANYSVWKAVCLLLLTVLFYKIFHYLDVRLNNINYSCAD